MYTSFFTSCTSTTTFFTTSGKNDDTSRPIVISCTHSANIAQTEVCQNHTGPPYRTAKSMCVVWWWCVGVFSTYGEESFHGFELVPDLTRVEQLSHLRESRAVLIEILRVAQQ